MKLTKKQYKEMIRRLLETESIQETYRDYIIKDITFKEWVVDMVDYLLQPR